MTEEERSAFENLILLCPNHHALIDDLEPDAHPVERLREMKRLHEEVGAVGGWPDETTLTRNALMLAAASALILNDAQTVREDANPDSAEPSPRELLAVEAIARLDSELKNLTNVSYEESQALIQDERFVQSLGESLRMIEQAGLTAAIDTEHAFALRRENLETMLEEPMGVRAMLVALEEAILVVVNGGATSTPPGQAAGQ